MKGSHGLSSQLAFSLWQTNEPKSASPKKWTKYGGINRLQILELSKKTSQKNNSYAVVRKGSVPFAMFCAGQNAVKSQSNLAGSMAMLHTQPRTASSGYSRIKRRIRLEISWDSHIGGSLYPIFVRISQDIQNWPWIQKWVETCSSCTGNTFAYSLHRHQVHLPVSLCFRRVSIQKQSMSLSLNHSSFGNKNRFNNDSSTASTASTASSSMPFWVRTQNLRCVFCARLRGRANTNCHQALEGRSLLGAVKVFHECHFFDANYGLCFSLFFEHIPRYLT